MSTNANEMNIFQAEEKILVKKKLPSYLGQVFLWMMFAVLLSGVTAIALQHYPKWSVYILSNSTRVTVLFLMQLAMVFTFRWITKHFSLTTAILYYALYAILTGITTSIIFLVFTSQSIIGVFFATAFGYCGLSVYGYMTKRDLGPIGSFCMMGLVGLIAVLVMSLFMPQFQENTIAQHVISSIGVLVFAGFTAFDVQRIKQNYSDEWMGNERTKMAMISGLTLYINFINLFFDLLDLLGGKK